MAQSTLPDAEYLFERPDPAARSLRSHRGHAIQTGDVVRHLRRAQELQLPWPTHETIVQYRSVSAPTDTEQMFADLDIDHLLLLVVVRLGRRALPNTSTTRNRARVRSEVSDVEAFEASTPNHHRGLRTVATMKREDAQSGVAQHSADYAVWGFEAVDVVGRH